MLLIPLQQPLKISCYSAYEYADCASRKIIVGTTIEGISVRDRGAKHGETFLCHDFIHHLFRMELHPVRICEVPSHIHGARAHTVTYPTVSCLRNSFRGIATAKQSFMTKEEA